MHIVALLIAVLGGAAFWWWRLKTIHEAGSEITDAAGRAWGKYKRMKFRRKAESSAVDAVDDPVAAAVVMMIAVAETEGELTPAAEAEIRRAVTDEMGVADPIEVVTFSKWVAKHVEDADNVSLRYAKLWTSALGVEDLHSLSAMVTRVAGANGSASARQTQQIAKLRERLGLGA